MQKCKICKFKHEQCIENTELSRIDRVEWIKCSKCKSKHNYLNPIEICEKCKKEFCFDHLQWKKDKSICLTCK